MATETAWVAAFFNDADSFDLARLVGWFADDVEVRFGNAPAIHGKAPAEEAFRAFWASITGMRHVREALAVEGATAMQFAQVTYRRHDGSEVTMPVASHLRRAGPDTIDRLWIAIDMSPLFQVAV